MLGAAELLRRGGAVQVDVLGEVTSVARVTPDLLDRYDAVVSIGETVQYALSMGIPCYGYDHVGGCGWLTAANLEHELWWNFSGRATRRQVDAATIAAELVAGFAAAQDLSRATRGAHAERWRLSVRIDRLLEPRAVACPGRKRLSGAQAERLLTFDEMHRGMYRTLEYHKDELARSRAGVA